MHQLKGNNKFRLVLDTAATHTTIDSNVLYFSGYELKDSKDQQEVETSNGIIVVDIYEIEQLECLGIVKNNFEVQVYDFFAHGVTSDYDGVIGLNYLKGHKICIDIAKGEISIDV
ncbi:MAG: aspartyl protease family protein [Bacteroidota bacterium]|nr:aspartyl protease family protein [Bacteroidota bacterium]